ncbi:MAG TPA: BrnA antitoxin family protein [Anaerolineales bacterium]|jgi:predicted DNA binding CopG/RHH family protein|nr:BrnA antitoxin family protein [Anaerolineales bacterium]HQX14984.1 BrnA antitoxin family protein [Anaerolineales bacterium]
MMNKQLPKFKNEEGERKFWADNDSSDLIDWKKAQRAVFPNLKPTLKSISLRLPESMISELRQLANERDVPYQSLIKHFLRESINNEYSVKRPKA